MKKGNIIRNFFWIFISVCLIAQMASASITISTQPKEVYNYGEVIQLPIKIIATSNVNNFLIVQLSCNGRDLEIGREPLLLYTGQEKEISYSIPLTKTFIGETKGDCFVNFIIDEEEQPTNGFLISDSIILNLKQNNSSATPLEKIIIEGTAVKENGKHVNGFIELSADNPDLTKKIESIGAVTDGLFSLEFSFPKETKSRDYVVSVYVYEKDLEENVNNKIIFPYEVFIKQIPTSIEIIVETQKINPSSEEKIKAVLYDQAGEKISSEINFQIRNGNNKLIYDFEKDTEEIFVIPVARNEAPAKWTVHAEKDGIISESFFEINSYEELKTEIKNNTIIFTNTGNIPYTKNAIVKIGDVPTEIPLDLNVDESQTYLLKAPNGEYDVSAGGISGSVFLTGRAIGVEKSGNVMNFFSGIGNYIFWIFVIGVLTIAFAVLFGKIFRRKYSAFKAAKYDTKTSFVPSVVSGKKELIHSGSRAEMAVSMKGENMTATAVCIKMKNIAQIKNSRGISETLQKTVDIAEMSKACTYESHDGLIFLFVPFRTKTMQNEKNAVGIAERIKDVLAYHNKVYKDKIDYGISVMSGQIVAKNRPAVGIVFTPLHNFFVDLKKLASSSHGQILTSEEVKNKVSSSYRTSSSKKENSIVDSKNSNTDVKKFMDNFMKRNQ